MDTTIICLLLASAIGIPTYLYWRRMMRSNQRKHDLQRDGFIVTLPTGLTEDRPTAFINGIGSTLNVDIIKNGGIPTIVFEVIATDKGIQHRVRFPEYDDEYLLGQLEAHLPGIDITPIEDEDDPEYTFAARVFMTNPRRPLQIANLRDYSTRLLKAIQTDYPGEMVTLQWVAASTDDKKDTETVVRPSFVGALVFGTKADSSATKTRSTRPEQHFAAVGRIAATAKDAGRAKGLVMQVLRALQSENDDNKIYAKQITDMSEVVEARTPTKSFGNLFTTSELVANLGLPIGDPQIPGLRQGAARRFPATENISRAGWVVGHSDVSGRPRPIAIDLDDIRRHVVMVGAPGTGKTAFANQGVIQIVSEGFGAIVMDAGTDISSERLYYRTLNTLPKSRMDDVVLINPSGDPQRSVALNLLDQGFGTAAIDIVMDTFIGLYPTVADTVNFREVVRHGLWALIEHGGHTIIDLAPLLAPRNDDEIRWAKSTIDSAEDQELIDFWARNPGAVPGHKERSKWEKKTEPVLNKLWNLTLDPNVRHLFGQSQSTVNIREILDTNKVLLVSLGGMDPDAAKLVANLLTTMIWRSTQTRAESGVDLERPNVLFVDEFQVLSGSHKTLADMLARGRALDLGVVLSSQFITRKAIDEDLRSTVLQAANTQIVFKAEGSEARLWSQQLGRHAVREEDISRLQKYHGIARMVGESSPVTFLAQAPLEPIQGRANEIERLNRDRYERDVSIIRREIETRRRPRSNVKPLTDDQPPKLQGRTEWNPDDPNNKKAS